MFVSMCTIIPGRCQGTRECLDELSELWAEHDCYKTGISKEEAIAAARSLICPPSIIIDSGGGIHCRWLFKETINVRLGEISADDEDDIIVTLKGLCAILAGDPKVCDLARVMRLPGTHNTKLGQMRPVTVLAQFSNWRRYDLAELQDMLDQQRPLLHPVEQPEGKEKREAADAAAKDAYTSFAERLGWKPPIDVEARLAAMTYHADDDRAIHLTQLAVSSSMVSRGHSDEEITELLMEATRAAAGHYGESWNWRREERSIRRMIADWREKIKERDQKAQKQAEAEFEKAQRRTEATEGNQSERPVIKIVGGTLPLIVDEVEQILIQLDDELYQRGDFIVRPAPEMVAISHCRQTLAMRLLRVSVPYLIEQLTRYINFQKYDARSKKWLSVNCPTEVATTYLARVGKWNLRPIAGIVEAPTLRPDGSIFEEPGYDAETGLLYQPAMDFSPIPQEPTKEQARAALNVLIDLLEEFPFVADPVEVIKEAGNETEVKVETVEDGSASSSRSVALSTILTAMIRRSISHAPLHAADAPVASSGKSLLVDLASLIATGHEAPVITQGKSEEEMEKRLGSMLLAGDTLISFDNCETPIGGELLCQALTQETIKVRILGRSETPTVPSGSMLCATGNNLNITGDMVRRAIETTLDPGVERPEHRKFKKDPIAMIKADRDLYVSAALTVLRAYIVAGSPDVGTTPLASFGEWSRWVRNALVWLGEPDPCISMEKTRAEDPEIQTHLNVMNEWLSSSFGNTQDVTVRTIIEYATEREGGTLIPTFTHPGFREALLIVAGEGGNISSGRLGKWLSKKKGRVINNQRIVQAGARGHAVRWRVEFVNE
jgi:hypothetical protein